MASPNTAASHVYSGHNPSLCMWIVNESWYLDSAYKMAESQLAAALEILRSTGPQILSTKQVALAFFVIHVYDHLLTLSDEVQYMWNKKFSLISVLFFMNRYYSLAFFCICTIPKVTPLVNTTVRSCKFVQLSLQAEINSRCEHFALFMPIAGGVVLTVIPDIVLALRVYALYWRNKFVAIALSTYIAAELGVALWIYLTPGHHPLELPPMYQNNKLFYLCIEEDAESLGNWKPSSFQLMQVVYDTIIIILILFKTDWDWKFRSSIQSLIASDGAIYYAVMFSANLTWALMILLAPSTLRYTAACPTLMLACTMINRLTISLRKYVDVAIISDNTWLSVESEASTMHAHTRDSFTGTERQYLTDEEASCGTQEECR